MAACRGGPQLAPLPDLGDGGRCSTPEVLHYRVGVVLEPAEHRLRARAELELSCLPRSELPLLLNPSLDVEAAFLEGRRVALDLPEAAADHGPRVAVHRLRYRGGSASSVLLELRYAGRLRARGTPLGELSEDSIELSERVSWYPRLAGAQHFTAELSAYAPARYRLAAPGRAQPPLTVVGADGAASREWRWTTERPRAELLLFGSPHLRSVEVTDRQHRQVGYYSTLPAQQVEAITATLAAARAQLQEALGPAEGLASGALVFVARSGPGYRSEEVDVVSEETARTSTTVAADLLLGLGRAWRTALRETGGRAPRGDSAPEEEDQEPEAHQDQPEQ